MIRLAGFGSGVPGRMLALLTLLLVVLSILAYSTATEDLSEAEQCRVDWSDAISARVGGAAEFSASCASFGGFTADNEVPAEFYSNLEEWEGRVQQEVADLGRDPWQVSARSVAGIPLVLFAVLLGSLSSGTQMGNGTAAWCLANGWTRGSWAASAMLFTIGVVVVAYLVIAGAFVVVLTGQLAELGVQVPQGPTESLLLPMSGLIFYAAVGVASGIMFRKAESAAIAAVLFVVLDLLVSRAAGFDFIPATLHSISMGLAVVDTSAFVASMTLLIGAVIVGGLILTRFVRLVDVPDRPV